MLTHEPDGVARCGWVTSAPDYLRYHDTEWGWRVRDERELFERLMLEAFQSGLSWLTILRKREAFRAAFRDFAPDVVAGFGDADVARLMADAAIVRNRRKIEATIRNARATLDLRAAGGLAELVWAHRPATTPAPRTMAEVPTRSPESEALARTLKAHGFVFVGPTTMYALMEAVGMVDNRIRGASGLIDP